MVYKVQPIPEKILVIVKTKLVLSDRYVNGKNLKDRPLVCFYVKCEGLIPAYYVKNKIRRG